MKRIFFTWLVLCAAAFGALQLSTVDLPHFKSAHLDRLLVEPAHAEFNGCAAGFCNPPAVSSGGSSVAFDAVATFSVAGSVSTTMSWTHTPIGTPNAVAVAFTNYEGNCTAASFTVTYGGSAMALSVEQKFSSNSESVSLWGIANPPSGPQTVSVAAGATDCYLAAGQSPSPAQIFRRHLTHQIVLPAQAPRQVSLSPAPAVN
jgi:hypothetical protein